MLLAAMNDVDPNDSGLASGVVGIGAVAFFAFCYTITRINSADRATTLGLVVTELVINALKYGRGTVAVRVEPGPDEADVIEQANDTIFGLAAYFYARDLGRVAEGRGGLPGLGATEQDVLLPHPRGGRPRRGRARRGAKPALPAAGAAAPARPRWR